MDEAHTSFLSESYRPKMQALVHLRKALVPKIFLTATLVPDHEQVLANSCGVSLARTLVLRSSTARPNHRLQMVSLSPPHTPMAVGLQLASLLLGKWEDDQAARGIIFVRTLETLRQVFKDCTFPACTYYGTMTDQEKERQLSSWLSGESPEKWIISTTALLHGVDYPRVDAVIFLESPFGLYDFVQGAGRAGRSSQTSLITVLYSKLPPMLRGEGPYICRKEMEHVLTASACRRAEISKAMDGNELSCFQLPGSLPCDLCEARMDPLIIDAMFASLSAPLPPPAPSKALTSTPIPRPTTITASSSTPVPQSPAIRGFLPHPPPKPPSTAMLSGFSAQGQATERRKHAESIKDLMDRYSGCFVCRIRSPDHQPCHGVCGGNGVSGCTVNHHVPFSCSNFSHKIGWINWKNRCFVWPKDATRCYFCGFPNGVVTYAHKSQNGNYPGKCKYSDTALIAAWHVLKTPHLFQQVSVELGFDPGADSDVEMSFGRWLMEYGSHSEDLRFLSVFSWLCRHYYPDGVQSN